MKHYLLLLGADQYLRERAVTGARQIYNDLVFTISDNPVTKPNRYFDRQIRAESHNGEDILTAIAKLKKEGLEPDAVVPLNDWTIEAAAYVNQKLGLHGLSPEKARLSRDKILMKQAFQKYGVKTADFKIIFNEEELLKAIQELNLPVIIKPSEFGGSGGVCLAHTVEEAKEAFHHSVSIMREYAESFHVDGTKFLVESFIDSDEEVSVEVICDKEGTQIFTVTEKYLSQRPYFAEMAHLVPSHRWKDESLRQTAVDACKALGLDAGLAHVEIKIKDGSYYVIEAAARPGGDGIMDQVERAYEINPYTRHILSYLGKPSRFLQEPEPLKTSAIAFLKAKQGVIEAVHPIPLDKLPEEIIRLEINAEPGKQSEEAICWRSREGILEVVYPKLFTEKTLLPVELAGELSNQIFSVRR